VIWRVEASPLNPAAPVALDGQVAQFTPTLPGTYYVTVNATDDLGEEDGTYLKLVVGGAELADCGLQALRHAVKGTSQLTDFILLPEIEAPGRPPHRYRILCTYSHSPRPRRPPAMRRRPLTSVLPGSA